MGSSFFKRVCGIIVLIYLDGLVLLMRFGVVGTNWITDMFIAGAGEHGEFEFVAVCSRSLDSGRAFADKYGVGHVFTDLAEMCESGLVDAVYIATPNYVHAEQSVLALERGVHVLCEKPAVTSVAELDMVVDAARRNGVLFMEAMRQTVTPNFLKVKEHLAEIGPVRRAVFHFNQYSSRYDKFKDGIVENAFRPELGNGAEMDLGVYCLASVVHLFGRPNDVLRNEYVLSTGAVGQGSMILTYDAMEAVVMYSKITSSHLPCEIQGEQGVIEINHVSSPSEVVIRFHDGSVKNISIPREHDWMYDEVAEFIASVGEGKYESSLNSVALTRMVVELLEI